MSTPQPLGVEGFLAEARSELDRVSPARADELRRRGALLVDIRPHHDRLAEGEVPGSVVVERIVLEWRLDPNGAHRIPGFTSDTPVVVLCNEGYASSLAARDLRAWAAAGLPVRPGGTPAIT